MITVRFLEKYLDNASIPGSSHEYQRGLDERTVFRTGHYCPEPKAELVSLSWRHPNFGNERMKPMLAYVDSRSVYLDKSRYHTWEILPNQGTGIKTLTSAVLQQIHLHRFPLRVP